MGNIVGEKFDDFVVNQINARQNLYGRGFGSTQLSPSNLLLLNNRNAWLKLASSVNVINESRLEPSTALELAAALTTAAKPLTTLGTQRLKDIGINNTADFLGNQLAKKAVLFNTLSTVTDNNKFSSPRSGVAKTNSLWNASNSYGLGGTDFGLNPAPGLISATIDNKNRGSIRTADIEIKAFNKFQFEMLELVYLRLGFTMMLEWGFDKYIDNKGVYTNMGNTIIEEGWFNSSETTQLDMLSKIQNKRAECAGNYDGFFGKVVNFDWNFNKNGSYDIKLKLVTLGDVIESIKTKTTAEPLSEKKIAELISSLDERDENYQEEKKRLEGLKDSNMDNNAGSSPLAQSLFLDIINPKLWDNTNRNFFSWNNLQDVFTSDEARKQQAVEAFIGREVEGDTFAERFVDNFKKNFEELGGFKNDYKALQIYFGDAVKNPLRNLDQYSYYMTFRVLLGRIAKYCVPSIGTEDKVEKQLKLAPIGDNNLCSAFPNQISFDPKICLIKPIFTPNMVGKEGGEGDYIKVWDWINKLNNFGSLSDDNTILYGNIMNIYLNYDFISKCLSQNMDEKGNISIYKFLTRICEGINSSLGNLQQLEVVVRDEIFVTIQDQNPIPGIERIIPELAPSIVPFEIFGFNTSGSVSSNFVTDFSFNTKITPQLASSISIGTTANNVSTKNYDGTAFSKWNSGLQDRYASLYLDPEQIKKEDPSFTKDESKTLSDQQIKDEFKAWSASAAISIELSDNQVISRINKNKNGRIGFTALGEDGSPTKKSSGYAKKIKSPAASKTYPWYLSLTWPQYIDKVIADVSAEKTRIKNKEFTFKELNEKYENDYNWYLIRAFSGKLSNEKGTGKDGKREIFESQYFLMDGPFAEQGKSVFQSYINTNVINKQFNENDTPSNTIGFIPADLGLTFKGLSGIKIYQQLAVRQDFLPKQYSRALKFLIKGVNHSISNNDWSTNLTTLSIPNVEAKLNLDGTPKYTSTLLSDGLLNSLTPNADALRRYLRGGALVINESFYEKGNEISNNGDISPLLKDTVIRLLQSINKGISNLPTPQPLEIRFTAGNDTSHAASNSRHPSGNALDFTLGSPSNPTWGNQLPNNKTYSSFSGLTRDPRINNLPAGPLPKYPSSQYEYINLIDTIMRDFVKTNLGTNFINEYYNPSSDASGPHFHFSISGGQAPPINTINTEEFGYDEKFVVADPITGEKVTYTKIFGPPRGSGNVSSIKATIKYDNGVIQIERSKTVLVERSSDKNTQKKLIDEAEKRAKQLAKDEIIARLKTFEKTGR